MKQFILNDGLEDLQALFVNKKEQSHCWPIKYARALV